ncbi:uncharacterized protein LOC127537061 [Acanthochromis polyacanthus]|uniref:uncharacterized protein LOC127537061 n=1 Tax=Acanthochromis polyacanthus TaxID=80966 RepID=UPI00223493CC|nr:uncharacterized protein LOC127537061 [Acanthochromis polyacanthus]XP_051814712.1 uncharacterized protein LOC127537061 [Acanthochromis polyacanthus]XP_051814713.1 uncharacterized protein LOC127537061 [Acanthochromis polyacanthus]XP_051814714.1 uncharacterized protein LOC127537061 [Acanthochromis polyacanthus]XP_051814715.1 uncharacterized protein LOC127537061 [Acanthochromis polyacanthus]XP_051814716.1 uncharacterized protein LOC127537061 [Acanthochromis polyacanthus]
MRREVLGKSLQVLTSSSVLQQNLQQLQRTEALQRTGEVLQYEEDEENSQSSQYSSGAMLRLDQLVETLQDRRQRAEQAVRLHLQQNQNPAESRRTGSEQLSTPENLDQNLLSGSRSEATTDLQPETGSVQKPGSGSEETRNFMAEPSADLIPMFRSDTSDPDLQPGPRVELKPVSRPADPQNLWSRLRLNLKAESTLHMKSESKSEDMEDLKPGSESEETAEIQLESGSEGSRLELKPGSRPDEIQNRCPRLRLNMKSGSRSEQPVDLQTRSGSDLMPESRSEKTKNQECRSRSWRTKDLQPRSSSDLLAEVRSEDTNVKPGSRLNLRSNSALEETRDLQPGSRPEDTRDLQPGSRPEDTRDLQPGSRPVTKDVRLHPALEVQLRSGSEENKDFQSGSRLILKPSSDVQSGSGSDLEPESISVETRNLKPGSGSEDVKPGSNDFKVCSTSVVKPRSSSDVHPGPKSDMKSGLRWENRDLQLGSEDGELREETDQNRPATGDTSGQTAEPQITLGKDTSSGADSAHHILLTNQRLLSTFEHLVEEVRRLMSSSCGGGGLTEAQHTLDTLTQAAASEAESLQQSLDQLRTSRKLLPLKALTEKLKRGGTRTSPPSAGPTGQVHMVLKDLQSLNSRITSKLQQLEPLVTFLKITQQVEEEMEEQQEEEEEVRLASRSSEKKNKVAVCWEERLQRLIITAQELGNGCIHAVTMVTTLPPL